MSSSNTEAALVDVTMPQMGVSVAEGTVVEWKKAPGDRVEADEIIAAISTDKIDTDVESPATGIVAELLVEVGTTVDVGTVLARISTAPDGSAPQPPPGEPAAAPGKEEAPTGTGEATAALEAPGEAGELQGDDDAHANRRRYSPVVMRMAAEHGLDLGRIEGTGRGGRVRKQDVLAYLEQTGGNGDQAPPEPPMHIESPYRPDEPAPPRPREPRLGRSAAAPSRAGSSAPVELPAKPAPQTSPLSHMRQMIGRRMLQSLQTAATCTTVAEIDMARVEGARARSGLTSLPYVARATVETLREFPALNSTLDGDMVTTSGAVHLGIAVSLGDGGLIVPVIHDAQDLSVEGLAGRIRDLAARARTGRLEADEVRGGTFTITNPGGYGSILATPVINQPQVAILDTEAVVKRPVVVTDELGNDAIAIRPMMFACMSWDHRALDGALAAQFLAALRRRLESWPPPG